MSQAAGILFPLIRRVLIEGRISDYGNLAQMLLQAGTELSHVTHLQTGADVLRAALHSDLPPDCVLSASQLPDMGAMHLLMALCGTDGMPVFPVVVVSPDDTRDEAERVLQAGGHGYVCVEGLTARSLVQELENTAIGWQLVRQLRDRQTRARRVTNHEAFQLGLTDAIHPQTDPHAIKAMAATRLGQYLQASRVTSAEKLEDDQVLVERGYVDRVAQIDGIYPLRELGGSKQSDLEAGRKIVCSELKSDSRYPDAEKANFAAIGIVANLKVPLLKNGELVATFGVHQSEPRQWTDREMAALRGVAERTRVAVEFARSESRRRAGQTRLAQMVETMPSFCVVLRGPNHIYEQANQRLYDTLGHGPEILGKPVLQALAEIASQPFPALLDVVYRTGQPFVENNLVARLPRWPKVSLADIIVDFVFLPLRETDGEVSGVFVHGLDRTGLELIKRAPDGATAALSLPVTERQLAHMARPTDNLLDVFRINSGKVVLRRERVRLQDVAANAVELSRPAIDAACHALKIEWPAAPIWLDAEPARLSQVFTNLPTDSAKYVAQGEQIGFGSRLRGADVVVVIADTGMGIPVDMAVIFDMFTQVNRTLDRAQGGIGIGLSLTRTVVGLHGGTETASSDGCHRQRVHRNAACGCRAAGTRAAPGRHAGRRAAPVRSAHSGCKRQRGRG